jgi:Ca-activated chloride channel family protein
MLRPPFPSSSSFAPIFLAVLAVGCPGTAPQAPTGRPGAGRLAWEDALVPATGRYVPPAAADLVREALLGTHAGPDDALGQRMQVRALPHPTPEAGANAKFDFDGGKRGWITALPTRELLTSPAYADGRLFLGGGFSSHQFYALAAFSGEMEWAMAAPDGGPTAAVVQEGDVIFNTESCTLFVADAATGALRWKKWLGDPLMSQPAAAEGLIFSAYPVSGGHELAAFRSRDGEVAWKLSIPADVIQAPHVAGDSVYAATMDGTLLRVERRTGREVWRRDVGASSAPWVDGDHVLLAHRVGTDSAPEEEQIVVAARDGRIRTRGDRTPAPYLGGASRDRTLAAGQAGAWGSVPHGQHLGLTNVAAGWAFQGSSPAVADGRAYFATGGQIVARDMATGRTVWRRAYREAQGAQALSPPAVVGSQLVFGTLDGHLYSTDIDTGMTLWAYQIGEPIVFQPIVAQGWVFVATGRGNVIGLEIADPAFDGWHMWGGNARHAGLVEHAGTPSPALLASLERPSQGTMRVAAFEAPVAPAATSGQEPTVTPAPTPPVEEIEEGGGEAPVVRAAAQAPMPELPLAKTTVRARVTGVSALVTVTQSFQNPHDRPIEAVYLFPLPADAAVNDMEMHIGERVVRARIQKKAQARATYTAARASGRRAALLEQQRPNLFAQRVANIQPGERIDVQLQYVQLLPTVDDQTELVFPMVAPRRYTPTLPDPRAPAPDPLAPRAGQPPALAAAPPEIRTSREIDLEVDLEAGLPLEQIGSATHQLTTSRPSASHAKVALQAGDRIPNHDFVLRWSTAGESPRATVLSHRGADATYFSLLVQPPAAPPEGSVAARQVTFVVDTSSSMNGQPLQVARAFAKSVIDTLGPADTFQVLAFADGVRSFAAAPTPLDAGSRAAATAFLGDLRATGATEMVPAIEAGLAATAGAGDRVPIVVLVTDGFIGNEADVLSAIATRLGTTRLYAVGVGSSVNRFLVERAAEIGRGRTTIVTLSEDPNAAAATFAARIARPVFTDVTVDWGGLEVRDVYPRHLPDLFAGQPLVVTGRSPRGGRGTVRVEGTVGGRRFGRDVEVVLASAPGDSSNVSLSTIWARAAVHDLENRLALRDDPALVEQVTRLGLAHRLVTAYTSFVAVDEEPAAPRTGQPPADAADPSRPTLSPARSLPGDPEIRVPAPRDARAVTVILPFGETVAAAWDDDLGLWSASFLIPLDAPEGGHPVDVLVTHADGRLERLRLWYTVDSAAPALHVEVVGDVRPGAIVTLQARQVVTDADAAQAGLRAGDRRLTPARAQSLADTRRVEARLPDGVVVAFRSIEPGLWEAALPVPSSARGGLDLEIIAVDVAANVARQPLRVEVP